MCSRSREDRHCGHLETSETNSFRRLILQALIGKVGPLTQLRSFDLIRFVNLLLIITTLELIVVVSASC